MNYGTLSGTISRIGRPRNRTGDCGGILENTPRVGILGHFSNKLTYTSDVFTFTKPKSLLFSTFAREQHPATVAWHRLFRQPIQTRFPSKLIRQPYVILVPV